MAFIHVKTCVVKSTKRQTGEGGPARLRKARTCGREADRGGEQRVPGGTRVGGRGPHQGKWAQGEAMIM